MKTKAMNQSFDDVVASISGILGGSAFILYSGITWQNAWESFGNLLWIAFVAMLSGGAGVLGKHLVNKYLNRKKRK